jgi:hypothetical protein
MKIITSTPSLFQAGFLLMLSLLAPAALQAGTTSSLAKSAPAAPIDAVSWKEHTISPVANFVNFEDPVIRTEIRPVYAFHNIDNGFITGGGEAHAAGVQVRYAVTDRLAIFLNQGGYIEVKPALGESFGGWADLGFGVKYALIDDEANQFILTPGIGFIIPSGDEEIFHGRGDGEWNFFLSAAKGFGDLHFTGNAGLRLPNDGDTQSSVFHYSLQADYYFCNWFIPFVFANGWTVVDSGNNLPLTTEGYDFFNFGSSGSDGVTQVTAGLGLKIRVLANVDLGFAYERAVVEPKGLFDDRFTFDVSIRF